jgi:glyoxylate carboligase
MQSAYAERFEREMGCTESEWLMWLPAAIGEHAWKRSGSSVAVRIGAGDLQIDWRIGEPRVIAQVRLPRLHVAFRFEGLDAAQRLGFMKRFDLYMQRGGG